MLSILLGKDSEEFINIEVGYLVFKTDTGRDSLIVYPNRKEVPETINDKVETMTAKFKIPDYRTHNEIMKNSLVYNERGVTQTSFITYKENILKYLLKEIRTRDVNQRIDETNYGSLNPTIAEGIFQAFNDQYLNPTFSTEELEKIFKGEKSSGTVSNG